MQVFQLWISLYYLMYPHVTHTYLLHCVWFSLFSNVPRSNPLTCLELGPSKQWRSKTRKFGSRWRKRTTKFKVFGNTLKTGPLRYLSEDFFPGFHILESLDATRFHVYARGVMSRKIVLLEFHSSHRICFRDWDYLCSIMFNHWSVLSRIGFIFPTHSRIV